MHRGSIVLILLVSQSQGGSLGPSKVNDIVQRSVENTNADWAVAPEYSFTERDIVTEHGRRTVKTYQVMMIEGSPYNKLIAANGHPLPPAQAASEGARLQQETARRRKETLPVRRKRLAEYQNERRQDQALLREMVNAFHFKMLGEETVNGRRCFVLGATPRPGYRPISRDTKVLTGMRGTMWIDAQQYQWVKVHAEVIRPVALGLFIAHVKPGTEFTLVDSPVQGNIWLPSHFSTRV